MERGPVPSENSVRSWWVQAGFPMESSKHSWVMRFLPYHAVAIYVLFPVCKKMACFAELWFGRIWNGGLGYDYG